MTFKDDVKNDVEELSLRIRGLPTELIHRIFLYCPKDYLPSVLLKDQWFMNQWWKINLSVFKISIISNRPPRYDEGTNQVIWETAKVYPYESE